MEKQFLYDIIEDHAPSIIALSDQIWELSELSMEEYRSAEYYCQLLEQEGFQVQRQLCGIPTAFSGQFGSGSPRIGILGEFDALSGLSQQAGSTQRQCVTEGGNGQGCGHNLLGAGAFGAALAIKKALEAGKLQGTVIFYGCPGEEGCAGKTFMARDGMFRDLDAALTWHPGDTNEIKVGASAACIQVEYSFQGLAAHAANDPYNGRSALDAVELMHVGVQFLREHMPPNSSIHYSITDGGGVSPNVVQAGAKTIFMVRGETVRKAKALLKRVDNIAKGAALMTDTQVTSRQLDGTASTVGNQVLEQVMYENLNQAPIPVYTEAERTYAHALRQTFQPELPGELTKTNPSVRRFVLRETENGQRDINDFIMPYVPCWDYSPGSTDVGDVSWLTPTAQFTTATWVSGSPGHSWQNVSIGRTSIAHKGMLQAAKILAGTAWDLMTNPALLAKAKEEFAVSAAEGYDCPIGPEVIPGPQQ
ncbi:MAG: amidohydrolase [Firmicutes bacterium]|nr:amidohydrolase [Bacillota bacterium]MDY6160148.1 amidohydrolase [Candidatus Faecousia sp.]